VTRAPVRVLAVDLGATSVRVVAVDLAAPGPAAQVLHRWRHGPVRHADGSLRWDWRGILREIERGLEAGLATGPVASIGVDGWGVDYGLLDGR
jgi:rhamnulokinase